MNARDKRVLLAGATGGIGAALLEQLGQAGASVMLVGRDEVRLQELTESLPTAQRLGWLAVDLRQPGSLAGLVKHAEKKRINTVVNLFGVNHFSMFDEQPQSAIDAVVNTNLIAPMALTRALLPLLLDAQPALIVNVGSVFGALGYPGYAAYCASKFGLRGFSEALHRELADTQVALVHIAPRATATPMSERAGHSLNAALGNAEDSVERVARAIMRVMSSRKPRSCLGWPERFFVWLNQVAPGVVDRALRAQLPTVRQHARAARDPERENQLPGNHAHNDQNDQNDQNDLNERNVRA